jgi:hypothetical protein
MWWYCWKSKNDAGTGMLDVLVLQESYRWCRDSNTRCGGIAEKTIECAGTGIVDVVV